MQENPQIPTQISSNTINTLTTTTKTKRLKLYTDIHNIVCVCGCFD